LLTFVSFLILLALAFLRDLSFSWLLIPTGAFVGLIVYHQRLKGRKESLQRSLAHYEQALRRLDGTWVGRGTTGEAYLEEGHLYAFDLDIFGPGSLFELLCLARTRTGEQTLAQWLSRPASWEEIPKRQEAITELTDRLDLREELAVLGEQV